MDLKHSPYLLYADEDGNVFEDTTLYTVGRSGLYADAIPMEDWIALPEGGSLYQLEGRYGVGIDVETGEMRVCKKGWATAAFVPPPHTGFYLASYMNTEDSPTLPLFCYTAVGWHEGDLYVPAIRIDSDIRQESGGFDQNQVDVGMLDFRTRFPNNRVVEHLADNCSMNYQCPAARNYFIGRWECPIPTSPACNSNCLGCISFQPEDENIESSQDRLTFKPTVGEIVEYSVAHLETAPYPIISFGQGCEGEPLLMWETLCEAIRQIRKFTDKGSININTNGSKPDAVEAMCKAGLNSIRVSTNSVQEALYNPYYMPNNYKFEDIIESIRVVNRYGGWTSMNYFTFPGMTDSVAEYEALRAVIKDTGLKMIQWRNFNIDPDWYLERLGVTETPEAIGVRRMMELLKEEFPQLQYGYYNPPMERINGNFELDFAH